MKYDTIYVDVDGVLADFTSAACGLFRFDTDKLVPKEFDLAKSMGITSSMFWYKINSAGPGFWSSLPVYEGAFDFIESLRQYTDRIVLLTRSGSLMYPESSRDMLAGKSVWIAKHFAGRVDGVFYVVDSSKGLVANSQSCLIDDRDIEIREFNSAGGAGILLPRIWNELYHVREDPYTWVLNALEQVCQAN